MQSLSHADTTGELNELVGTIVYMALRSTTAIGSADQIKDNKAADDIVGVRVWAAGQQAVPPRVREGRKLVCLSFALIDVRVALLGRRGARELRGEHEGEFIGD